MREDHKEERKNITKEVAFNLIQDLTHIRTLSNSPNTSPAELRRATSILRRILIDGDLLNVASPRIGRVLLITPNNKVFIKKNRKEPLIFFGSGGGPLFGAISRAQILSKSHPYSHDLDLGAVTECRLDGFLSQEVLCINGKLINRKDIIEYMANIASGVHSGSIKNVKLRKQEIYKQIHKIRFLSK